MGNEQFGLLDIVEVVMNSVSRKQWLAQVEKNGADEWRAIKKVSVERSCFG